MNILNVTTIEGLRGGDIQMYTIYNLLREYDDMNQFILCPENADLAQLCRRDGAQCYFFKRNRFKILNAIRAIIKICRKEKIDVIHIHDSTALNYALAALPFLPKSIKLVLSRKRNNKIRTRKLNYWKYSHPRIVKIVSVSKAVEDIFEPIIKERERLTLIYDAIDVSKFEGRKSKNILHTQYNWAQDVKVVGNIAGLTPQKDIYTFIDTAKIIMQKNNSKLPIKFVVIGAGALQAALEVYTREQGLENELYFTGFRSDAGDLLPELDCFLMTSITEGLPLTIYEAFAAAVPVVSTDAGGIKEVLEHKKTGLMADVKDADALAGYVLELLSNDALANSITAATLSLVKQHFDLPVLKRNYYNFYKSLQ